MRRCFVCLGLLLVACGAEDLTMLDTRGTYDGAVDMGDGGPVPVEAGPDGEVDASGDGGDDVGRDGGLSDGSDGGSEMDADVGEPNPRGWTERGFIGQQPGRVRSLGHRVLVSGGYVFAAAEEHTAPAGDEPTWRLFRASNTAGTWAVDREMTGRDIGSSGFEINALESDGDSVWVGVTKGSATGEVWRMPLGLTANPARVSVAAATTAFGFSIAVKGRWLAVGDPGPDVSGQGELQTGAVHLFEVLGPNDVEFRQTLTSSAPTNWQRFGHSVALTDDRLIVGAPSRPLPRQATWASVSPSAAYEFVNEGGTWNPLASHRPTGGRGHLRFGMATASTSSTSFLVAAPEAYSCVSTCNGQSRIPGRQSCPAPLVPCSTVGTVFETGGAQLRELPPENWAVNHYALTRWGSALSASEDWLVIAARGDSSGSQFNANNGAEPGSGAVHLIARNPAATVPYLYLKADDGEDRAQFGWDVSIEGNTLAIGARQHRGREPGMRANVGAVYIVRISAN